MRIKEGDWVMVTKASSCCGATFGMGLTFTVENINYLEKGSCVYCCKVGSAHTASGKGTLPFRTNRLIKMPPPSLPESAKYDQEIEVRV